MLYENPKAAFLKSEDYDFLFKNPNLGTNVCLAVLSGSRAYGTDVEGSDIDLRGFAIESKRQIISGENFEQVVDRKTDTVIYSMKKMFNLLSKSSPNIIEMLGCRAEDYFILNGIGQRVLDNKSLFLSKKAFYTFSGYASAQMKLLSNYSGAPIVNNNRNDSIIHSVKNCLTNVIKNKEEDYSHFVENMNLILPPNGSDESYLLADTFINIDAGSYNVKDLYDIIGSIHGTITEFTKGSRHNSEAAKYNKMGKHMMHLLRLYMMVIDILNDGEIITYREKEHDLLMSVRNKEYLESDGTIKPKFFDIVREYEGKAKSAFENSKLPDKANTDEINNMLFDIYEETLFRQLTDERLMLMH